ncbi:hypothetical protein BU23DRAFT_38824 [Bimuria novae-zelandiae CBS 107.79]|uniref:Uncharacterized protein n=1 Tax=Bimuria novae-zelandiae CBS 107.79 TaxID=1447943 RepID=A0A6A5UL26_9PLEO|nr:hypothetical protein BU23DRAFT_38824 [Bimuria novae-zelandiae CBS 107.79]
MGLASPPWGQHVHAAGRARPVPSAVRRRAAVSMVFAARSCASIWHDKTVNMVHYLGTFYIYTPQGRVRCGGHHTISNIPESQALLTTLYSVPSSHLFLYALSPCAHHACKTHASLSLTPIPAKPGPSVQDSVYVSRGRFETF